MRIRLDNTWIAGHPDYEPGEWTTAQGATWLPTRTGAWDSGAGWERAGFEDRGNAGFSLQFGVTRAFATRREAIEHVTSLHSRMAPHPWHGAGLVRYDREDGGAVDLTLGDCVLQLAGPPVLLGALSVQTTYLLHGGVVGAQPVLTDPTAPEQDDIIEYGDYGP